MATVTPLRVGGGKKPMGEFKVQRFSMFDDEDMQKYADFRNLAEDKTNGIKIEVMREYSRKTTTIEGSGESQSVQTTEEIILVIHYWEKPAARPKGDSDEELGDAKLVVRR